MKKSTNAGKNQVLQLIVRRKRSERYNMQNEFRTLENRQKGFQKPDGGPVEFAK